jgi:hypothetical protein
MENMKNSKCFERLVKYQDVDIKYPGILDLLYEIAYKDDMAGHYHPSKLSIQNSFGLEIFVFKPWLEQGERNVCEILNKHNVKTSIRIRTRQRSVFGLDHDFEDMFFDAIKKALE